MVKAANVLEVEIADDRNRKLWFSPLGRALRGRFDFQNCQEPKARLKASEWPESVIPGQRIGLNLDTAEGRIIEPLHDGRHSAIRERIESLGMKLPPERESFCNVDLATWAFWLGRAVQAGKAHITQGELPRELPGEPQRAFFVRRQPSDSERLALAIERQTAVMEKLLTKLASN